MIKILKKATLYAVGSVLCMGVGVSYAQTGNALEVQSVFIYNFLNYVKWPQDTANHKLCIYGNNDIAETLEKIRAKQAKSGSGRAFVVEKMNSLDVVSSCSVVYLDNSLGSSTLDSAVKKVGSSPVLTVSNDGGFVTKGGMVSMEEKDNKPHLIINEPQARNAGLQVSSRLLAIAEVK